MGANTIFKLMAFSLLLNFSVGIMYTAVPAFTPEFRGGMNYNESYSDGFTVGMNGTVTPNGNLQDEGDSIYRVLDTLTLGFVSRFISAVDRYLFGFIQVLEGLLGGLMGDALNTMVFGSLRVIISICYIIGAWTRWTGKDKQD